MSIWFKGSNEIRTQIQKVKLDLENLGTHYAGVIRLMPGITHVELLDQGSEFVTLKTNEGILKRTNITKQILDEGVVVEFDEEAQGGSLITVKSHFKDEFMVSEKGINHRTVISNVRAPGVMGFFYRTFGKSNIGNAILISYKTYFEEQVH